MYDNELITLVISTIIAQEATAIIPTWKDGDPMPIAQAFQPTQQGVNTEPTAYMYKIGDHRYGWRGMSDVWDTVNSIMVHTEVQYYETTFQISVLSTQDPANPIQFTASDLANKIAYILQSQKTVETFQAAGVGIERVTDVRNPYFSDDRNRNEACPSFDFVLTHKQIVSTEDNVLLSTEFQILTV